jgi:hypothetical protein
MNGRAVSDAWGRVYGDTLREVARQMTRVWLTRTGRVPAGGEPVAHTLTSKTHLCHRGVSLYLVFFDFSITKGGEVFLLSIV